MARAEEVHVGFVVDQRLLIAYGQSWREVWSDRTRWQAGKFVG